MKYSMNGLKFKTREIAMKTPSLHTQYRREHFNIHKTT